MRSVSVVSDAEYDLGGTSIGGMALVGRGASARLPIGDSSGNELAWKFFGLGCLTGKTAAEVIAGVGMPASRRSMANGQMLLQWQAIGYDMALLFNSEERVVKITYASAHFASRR